MRAMVLERWRAQPNREAREGWRRVWSGAQRGRRPLYFSRSSKPEEEIDEAKSSRVRASRCRYSAGRDHNACGLWFSSGKGWDGCSGCALVSPDQASRPDQLQREGPSERQRRRMGRLLGFGEGGRRGSLSVRSGCLLSHECPLLSAQPLSEWTRSVRGVREGCKVAWYPRVWSHEPGHSGDGSEAIGDESSVVPAR